jgi:hypothetical protein
VTGLTTERKLLAVGGFVALGLSPSFEDWFQSPEDRGKMLAFYGVGVALIWLGLFRG